MEPEGSLPHLQMPATCPYLQPARSSTYHHNPLPEDPSKYYSPIYAWVSQVVSVLPISPPKPCIHFFSSPYVLHDPPILRKESKLKKNKKIMRYKPQNNSMCKTLTCVRECILVWMYLYCKLLGAGLIRSLLRPF